MDSRIENLKSTTFCGTRLTRRQIADLQKTVKMFPALSRHELAATLCTHLGWFTPKGRDRLGSCLRMLEQLEAGGIVSLPAKRPGSRTGTGGRRPRHTSRSDPGSAIECELKELMPLELEVVAEGEAVEEWKEWVDRHHELGYRHPFGCFLRYWLRDRRGRKLGCLLFEAGTTRLPCRDAWIGWRDRDRAKRLKGVVNNSRFLIFPWVRVPYLASKALSMAVRRLAARGLEGAARPGAGTGGDLCGSGEVPGDLLPCGQLQCIGRTKGRKANASEAGRTPKDVYLYPLTKDWKQVLLTGSRRSGRRSRRSPATVLAPEDTFVRLWSGIVETLVGVANRHDRLWQRRRRVLNTLAVRFPAGVLEGASGICDHAGRTVGAVPDDGDRTATAGSGVAVLHLQCPGQAGRAAVQDLTPGNPQGGLRRRGTTPARTESPSRHGSAVAGASGVCGRWKLPEPASRTGA